MSLRYYDGQLVRTIDDPLQVSRGAGFFILSQGERIFFIEFSKSESNIIKCQLGLFGGGWFVEGNVETYEGTVFSDSPSLGPSKITMRTLCREKNITKPIKAEHGLPVTHKVDYVRYWKELPFEGKIFTRKTKDRTKRLVNSSFFYF